MKNALFHQARLVAVFLSTLVAAQAVCIPLASAGHGAAWGIGGLLAGHVLTGAIDRDKERTRAARSMAASQQGNYYVATPVAVTAPPPASAMTPEQKLNQLDKLAAGGYITPAEYKARRKAILDGM